MWVTRPRPCFASGGSVGLAEGRLTGTIESGKCSLHPKLETRRDTWPPDGRTNGWMPSRTGFRGGVIDLLSFETSILRCVFNANRSNFFQTERTLFPFFLFNLSISRRNSFFLGGRGGGGLIIKYITQG